MRALLFILLSALAASAAAQNEELTRKQAEFIQKLRSAEGSVRTLQNEVNRQQGIVNTAKKNLDKANEVVTNTQREVRIRAAFAESIAFGKTRQEKHLLKVLKRYQDRIDILQDRHNNGNLSNAQKQQIYNELSPLITGRGKIQRQINRIKNATDLEGRKARAKAKLKAAREKLKAAVKATEKPKDELAIAEDFLTGLKKQLQKAKDELAALRAKAGAELNGLNPVIVKKVRILSPGKDKVFYDAEWRSKEDLIKRQIEVMNKIIADQQPVMDAEKRLRLSLADQLGEVNEKWQALNQQYIDLIHSEKWENIFTELSASTVGVLWNSKGSIVTNLFLEAGFKVYDWQSGNYKPDFGYPKINTNKTRLEHGLQKYQEVFSVNKLQATLATLIEDEGIEKVEKFIVESKPWSVFQGAINRAVPGQARNFAEGVKIAENMRKFAFGAENIIKKDFVTKIGKIGADTFANIYKGAAINAGKSLLREYLLTSRKERIEVYQQMYVYDLQWKAILHQLEASRYRSKNEENKLDAANKFRDKLLAQLDTAKNERYLHTETDEVVEDKDNKAVLELNFTSEVRDVKVDISGKEFRSALQIPRVEMNISLDDMPDIANMTVNAKHAFSLREIDSEPKSIASFNTQTKRWSGYTEGGDKTHKFRLKSLKDGISLVFLFDCSGSMKDNNKIVDAKAAAKKILQNKELFKSDNNEIAVWCFVGGFPKIVTPFTNDVSKVIAGIDSLSINGGTPLASSILQAGNYLVESGSFKRKALIVLSDGQDTAGGNPQYAIQLVKERAEVSKRGW